MVVNVLQLPITLSAVLAQVPDTPAGRAGYYVGIGLAIVFSLGVIAFGLFAVVMAFVRRTKVWIITASIAACFLIGFGAFFTLAFIKGVKEGMQASSSTSGPAQSITGNALPYTLQVSPGWTVKRSQGVYDVLAAHGSSFVSVIAEPADLGGSSQIAEAARSRIKELGSDVVMSEPQPISIDGRDWLQFTVKCKVKLMPFAYQFYVYSGKEGSFQLIGWTFQNLWDREAAKIQESLLTFHFPKDQAAASPK